MVAIRRLRLGHLCPDVRGAAALSSGRDVTDAKHLAFRIAHRFRTLPSPRAATDLSIRQPRPDAPGRRGQHRCRVLAADGTFNSDAPVIHDEVTDNAREIMAGLRDALYSAPPLRNSPADRLVALLGLITFELAGVDDTDQQRQITEIINDLRSSVAEVEARQMGAAPTDPEPSPTRH
jgi:transposase